MAIPYGKYELLERIGTGGMAEVFRARLPGIAGFEKIVVIKRLHPHFAGDAAMVQMFVDEAKLAAAVQHKNVVQVYELDRLDNGELFIVMEYVNGVDLKKLLRHAENVGSRVPPWLSIHIVCEVLDALNHAYDLVDARGRRRNIVHRDVSPENIFIGHHGEVKLGDFGVARDDTRNEPLAHEAKGKLGYMAPEQFAGERLDQRCDVFSAGVVLWECLTQHRLFRGESDAETMNLVTRGPRIAPSRIARDVPEEVDPIVLWTLHIDRTKRTPSARALQEQLLGVLHEIRGNCSPVDVRAALRQLLDARAPEDEHTQAEELIADELIVEEQADLRPSDKTMEHVVDLELAVITIDEDPMADVWDDGASFRSSEDPTIYPLPDLAMSADTVAERKPSVRSRAEAPFEAPAEAPAESLLEARTEPPVEHRDDAGWDGTYAIINPRLKKTKRKSSPRHNPEPPETEDLLRRRLVYEVPIPAKPSQAETGDILKQPPPRDGHTPSPAAATQPGQIVRSGSQPDQQLLTIPISSSHVWAPYDGPHPFWMRLRRKESAHDEPFGPCSYVDLLATVYSTISKEAKRSIDLSADGKHWVPLPRFLDLIEYETFESSALIGAMSGTLGAPSLIALFGEIAERFSTGKLTLIHSTGGRAEVHIAGGVPVYVATDVPSLTTPELLASCRVLEREALVACVHGALREDRPLAAIVGQRARLDMNERRPMLLLARLEAVLEWTGARYSFSPVALTPHPPVSRTVYSVLFELVQRARSPESLRTELSPWLGMRFERTERFDRAFSQLDLSQSELDGLGPFGFTRTLDEAVRTSTGGERFAWAAAYVLLELGFLRAKARVHS